MVAAIEEIRVHLQQAAGTQDVRRALVALLDAVDALGGLDFVTMPDMRLIGIKLAEECLQIMEARATRVFDARDKVALGHLRNAARGLLDTGLASKPRLHALLGEIENQAERTRAGDTDSDRITQLLAWAFEKPDAFGYQAARRFFRGTQRSELISIRKAKRIYEIEALAALNGMSFGRAQAALQRREIAEQIRILAHEKVQCLARETMKKEIRGILAGRKQHVFLDDLAGD
jgi:hypothetical protein